MNNRICCTALTGRIMMGRVNAAGNAFVGKKTDVTSDVLKAVIDKAEHHGGSFEVAAGDDKWNVTVKKVGLGTPADPAPAAGAAPTDAEIDAVWKEGALRKDAEPSIRGQFRWAARAVLARWGAAAPVKAAAPTLDAADLAILSAGAKSGDPGALALAAQLAGVPACPRCGYVKHHCRCAAYAQEAEDGWMPIETAPEGERVLLGPRHAPVVGTVNHPMPWDERQEITVSVVHYNGNRLVAGYRCSEWHRLPGAARARQEGCAA